MSSPLSGIVTALIGLFFVCLSGWAVWHGQISVGRHTHRTIYEATDPHGFWTTVTIYAILGGVFFLLGIYRFISRR